MGVLHFFGGADPLQPEGSVVAEEPIAMPVGWGALQA